MHSKIREHFSTGHRRQRVAPVDKLSVAFATVLAAMVLGEKLYWQHYVGGAFIVTGAMILAWA